MYDRVLYPTDGSDGAEVATAHAIEVARRFEAPLHVLYVVDVSAAQSTDAYDRVPLDATVEALEGAGEEIVDRVRERAAEAGLAVDASVVEGMPASAIVGFAEADDVIVMGTHGRTGLDRYLIGSTTEKVVRTADVPVVTVPMTETQAPDDAPGVGDGDAV
ncbi:universal stress protein [Halomicrobium urmianum]|uniref:universal stress protein n=1 Tax=Halomicrobium urmianum TaxID=1586233 RepID=UPI001CDA5314|nr:universal stress protein [Halomicrobium urmianum]